MSEPTIKYGIGFDYLSDWGPKEALREVYQNFVDFGDHDLFITKESDYLKKITFRNTFIPKGLELFRIGFSEKKAGSIGCHGEGLKMAMLVLCREGYDIHVRFGYTLATPIKHDDQFLGECFGINISQCDHISGFEVSLSVPEEDCDSFFADNTTVEMDSIFTSSYGYGSIVDKEPGNIYVGGIYVCKLPKYHYSYNFPADKVKLDRDRKVPNGWDVSYYASKIVSEYKDAKITNFDHDDTKHLSRIPEKLMKVIKPAISNGKIIISDKNGNVLPKPMHDVAMSNEKMQKSVAKLQSKVYTSKKPHTIMTEVYDKLKPCLYGDYRTILMTAVEKSKNWRKA